MPFAICLAFCGRFCLFFKDVGCYPAQKARKIAKGKSKEAKKARKWGSGKNVRNPNFSKKYRNTHPICIARHLQFVLQCALGAYALRKDIRSVLLPFVSQYSSHLYRSTSGKILVVVVTGMFPIRSSARPLAMKAVRGTIGIKDSFDF